MSRDPLGEAFVLNPVLELRPDKRRAVLFHTDPVECGKNPFTKFVSPRMAIFLSLFDGICTLDEVVRLWAQATGQEYHGAVKEAVKFLEANRDLEEDLLLPAQRVSAPRRAYKPADFILDSQVDLTSLRCYAPIGMTHELCYRCATACIYCYSDLPSRTGDLLPLPRLDEIVAEARHLGIPGVAMSGGDPFCHPKVFKILHIYCEQGIRVDVPTKIPLNERQLRRLKEMPRVRLQFSIDGAEPEINDWLVGVKGHTERMLHSLLLAKRVGLSFSINMVLTVYNHKQGVDFLAYLVENFEEQVKRISLTPYGRSIYRHVDGLFLPSSAYVNIQERVAYFKDKYPGVRINLGSSPDRVISDPEERHRRYIARSQCTGNRTNFVMLPDGKVTVCEELYYHPSFLIGDLAKQSIMEVWKGEPAAALARPDQRLVTDGPCSTCPEFDACHGAKGRCYKKALQAYGYDKPHWPDPSCPYAPLGEMC